jgi:hypothetical protein
MAAKCEKSAQEAGVANGKPERGRRVGGRGGRVAAGGRREEAALGGRGARGGRGRREEAAPGGRGRLRRTGWRCEEAGLELEGYA